MTSDTITSPESEVQPTPVVNYWGTDELFKHYLPDGVQYFECKIMNEGARAKFQKMTNQDMEVRRDQSARVRIDPVAERHTLIETSVTSWHLFMPEAPGSTVMVEAKFSPAMLKNWLQVAPPKLVDDLEFAIRKANPWMQADMPVEEIDKEIDRLIELKKAAIEREAGEASSATK